MSDINDRDLEKIEREIVSNTRSENTLDLTGVNPDRFYSAVKGLIRENDFSCEVCGGKGGDKGEKELVVTSKKPLNEYKNKNKAITTDNLKLICKSDYYDDDVESGEAVAQYKQESSTSKSERAKRTLTSFERIVSQNTPTRIVKSNIKLFMYIFLIGLFGLGVYSVYTNQNYFDLIVYVVSFPSNVISTLYTKHPLVLLASLLPIIALYTLFEYYQPPKYFTPDYTTSYTLGAISIPHLVHPTLLGLSTLTWVGISVIKIYGYAHYIPISTEILLEVGSVALILYFFLLITFPSVMWEFVKRDRSTVMGREVMTEAEIIAAERGETKFTENTIKGKINKKFIKDAINRLDYIQGDFFAPIVWMFFAITTTVYVYLLIFTGINHNVTNIQEIVIVCLPLVYVIIFYIFRYAQYRKISRKFSETAKQVESKAGLGGGDDR